LTLHEPDVALTDFLLSVECFGMAVWLLWRGATPKHVLKIWFVTFFMALGVGALLGGISHGFLPDEQTSLYRWVWRLTLTSIGVGALASWMIGAELLFNRILARAVRYSAGVVFVLYASIIFLVDDSFVVAIVHYFPAAIFLFGAFLIRHRSRPAKFLLAGSVGLVITFVAAAIQRMGIGWESLNLTHNAVYHLIQMPGIALIFVAGQGVLGETSCEHDETS
jgi:hypothetical protein